MVDRGLDVVRQVRRVTAGLHREQCTDPELLRQFAHSRDESAFATLVRRHGPMVMRICRHVLHQEQDAEDAFQVTFLVLARNPAAIRKGGSLASWLHGVAYRTALTARRSALTRQRHETRAETMSKADAGRELEWREVQALLEEEVQALPEMYRAPFVLCQMEGRSRAEVARELEIKEGTVSSRLQRAHKRLQERLSARGVALAAVLAALAVTDGVAAVPRRLITATVRAGLAQAGGGGTGGAISANGEVLLRAVTKTLGGTRGKAATALLAAVLIITGGAGLLGRQTTERPAEKRAVQPNVPQRAEPTGKKQVPVDQFGDPLPAGAVRRLGTLRFRQGGGQVVNVLLLSTDGKKLVSSSFYGSRMVCVWELASGKLLHQFPGHYEENRAVALSPDGMTLAIGHDDSIRFWDLASGKESRRLKAPLKDVQGLAFSPDGKTLASGHGGRTVVLWDLPAGKTIDFLPARHNRLTLLAFTPDGKTLITGSELDQTIRLFNVATRKQHSQLTPPQMVRGFSLSPDGRLLALGAHGGPISIWGVKTSKKVHELRGAPFVFGVAFSPDGKTLASAEYEPTGGRNAIGLWDVATGKLLRRLEKNIGWPGSILFSADGKTLIAGNGGTIRLWDVATGKERGPAAGNPEFVGGVAVSPDGRTLAYTADSSIRLWDLAAGREVGRLAGRHWSVAFSPDGKILAGGMGVNKVNLWDVAGRRLARHLEIDPKKDGFPWVVYYHVAFSPDGKLLASAGGYSTNQIVQLWDLASGKKLRCLRMKEQKNEFCTIEAVAFSPDGRTLAASGRGVNDSSKLRLWEVASGKRLATLNAALNDPSDKGVPAPLAFPQGPIIMPRLALSADGKMLALSRWQKTIPVWEAASGKQRCLLEGHEGSTVCVAFAPDGRTLASASWDNTIRLWDLETGKELRKLTGHRGRANALAFSPDGQLLISSGEDTTILFWDVKSITHRARLRSARLSAAECEALWKDLADSDAVKAYRAITRLTAAPEKAVTLLQAHLKPAPPVDGKRVAQVIRRLDDRRFAVRERAMRELERLAEGAQPALHQVLQGQPSLELRRRAEALLEKLATVSDERLRKLRAVEVLERAGTPGARQFLTKLATGLPTARVTQEAKTSLARLTRRLGPPLDP